MMFWQISFETFCMLCLPPLETADIDLDQTSFNKQQRVWIHKYSSCKELESFLGQGWNRHCPDKRRCTLILYPPFVLSYDHNKPGQASLKFETGVLLNSVGMIPEDNNIASLLRGDTAAIMAVSVW